MPASGFLPAAAGKVLEKTNRSCLPSGIKGRFNAIGGSWTPEPWGAPTMKIRLILAGGLLLALSGCATYDYVGSGGGGGASGYYHGTPSTQYRYPYGYPSSYPYGYGSGYYGGGYYGGGYPVYRPYPNYRPPHHHRPPQGGHRPPPDRPRPPRQSGSPWRNMDGNSGPRPNMGGNRPSAPPQSRPSPPPRPASPRPGGSPWRNMNRATERQVEP